MSADKREFEVKTGYAEIPDTDEFLNTIRVIGSRQECHIICLDGDQLAGLPHVMAAVSHAMRAWAEGSAIADSIEMEVLCYASGSRQCSAARTFGIHRGTNRLYIVIFPLREGIIRDLEGLLTFTDENWDDLPSEKMERLRALFHITALELAAAGEEQFRDLVLERVALLDVYK